MFHSRRDKYGLLKIESKTVAKNTNVSFPKEKIRISEVKNTSFIK